MPALLVVLLATGARSAERPCFSFISLDLPNSTNDFGTTDLLDINDETEIVAGFADSRPPHGVLIVLNRELTSIAVPGAARTTPHGINAFGHITGWYSAAPGLHGFVRDGKGKFTTLEIPGAIGVEPTGINDRGQVVGNYTSRDLQGDVQTHVFLWHKGVTSTIAVPFPMARITAPMGINRSGDIAGFYDDLLGRHGFVLIGGQFSSVDFPGNDGLTAFEDINDRGQAVGIYSRDETVHGFLFENGVLNPIDVPFANALNTSVRGISDDGKLVGSYSYPANGRHGFIAYPQRKCGSRQRK